MKVIAVDYGLARTGLAACDPAGLLAYPLTTLRLEDFRGRKELLDALAALVRQEQAEAVVLGLPLLLDGSESMTTRQVRNVAERLKRRIDVPLYFMSEVLSSEEALQDLQHAGYTWKQRKKVLDQQAAVRILQSFLALPPEQRICA